MSFECCFECRGAHAVLLGEGGDGYIFEDVGLYEVMKVGCVVWGELLDAVGDK